MKQIYILSSILFLIFGCVTSKKNIDKSKTNTEKSETKVIKIDSIITHEMDTELEYTDSARWSNLWDMYDFSFIGNELSDELEITKTENGFKVKGKGKVTGKKGTIKVDSVDKKFNSETIIEKTEIVSNRVSENKSKDSKSQINKSKKKFSIAPTFGITIGLILFGLLIIYLIYRYFLKKI